MKSSNQVLGAVAIVLVIGIVLSILLSYPAMLLWNLCLVPAIPALAEVGWLQMWGISVLVMLLKGVTVSTKS